jgi:AAHS family 4-hydroxybenzoate transporter-like MFS transporter
VPLLALPILARGLPESARFLSLRGGRAQLAQLLARIAPAVNIPADTNIVVREEKASARPVAQLFSERRALMTVLLWVVFFMSLLDLYLLSNWLPTVLSELGVSISMSAAIGAMLQVGGVIGAFALGSLIDRFSFRALACIYFLAAIAIVCIGYARHSIPLVTFAIACAGFCIVGGQTASNALAATYYPSAIRSTGVGWALGIGRVGSIIGPLAAGVMLARQAGVETLFLAASVPALCACAAAFGLSGIARSQGPAPHQ